MKQNKQFFRRLLAVAFWLAVWQAAAMAIGQEMCIRDRFWMSRRISA